MSANLTNNEKAKRYDALQTAIKYTIERYRERAGEASKHQRIHAGNNVLNAYDLAVETTLYGVIQDLERWTQ